MRIPTIAVLLAAFWWFLTAILAEIWWFNPTGLRLIGFALIGGGLAISLSPYRGWIPYLLAPSVQRLRWLGQFLWLNKALSLAVILAFLVLSIGLYDLSWFLSGLFDGAHGLGASFVDWLIWNLLLNGFVLAIAIGLVWYFRQPIQAALQSITIIGLVLMVNKFLEMKLPYKLLIGSLTIASVVLAIAGRTIDLAIVLTILIFATYRGWPRENPFDPPPVGPFELPVVRVLAAPHLIAAFSGVVAILFVGLAIMVNTGFSLYPLVGAIAAAQVFFLVFVDRVPGITTAWTRITIFPLEEQIVFDRAKSGAGETSLIPLKLGPFRLKERKGIVDNLFRLLGWYLFEAEPLGEKREKGEQETFEVYINTLGFEYRFGDRVLKGPRALLFWMGTGNR